MSCAPSLIKIFIPFELPTCCNKKIKLFGKVNETKMNKQIIHEIFVKEFKETKNLINVGFLTTKCHIFELEFIQNERDEKILIVFDSKSELTTIKNFKNSNEIITKSNYIIFFYDPRSNFDLELTCCQKPPLPSLPKNMYANRLEK